MPMPIQNPITEDECRPHTASKRKQRGETGGKTRATPGSKKTFKTVRQSQPTLQHPYSDELQRLEAHAKRINQILAEQSNKSAIRETNPTEIADTSLPHSTDYRTIPEASTPATKQIAQESPHAQPVKNQWHSPTPVEEQTIETSASQEHSIHQRLVELGLHLNEAGALISVSRMPSPSENGNHARGQSPAPQPPAPTSPINHSPTQAWEAAPSELWDEEPSYPAKTGYAPSRDRGIAANRDLPRDRSRSRSFPVSITTLRRYFREWRGYLYNWRSLELPRQPIDRISDAALWIAASAIVRVASRYVLAAFPILSPLFLILMLSPAIAAVYLVFCVPKAGWVSYYRLFLTMVGFLIGGKL